MKKPLTVHQRAQDYTARSWAVIPLHSVNNNGCTCGKIDCRSPGKHPRTRHGVKDASLESDQIDEWFKSDVLSNIGIATGAASGLLVLDIDPRNDGTATLEKAQRELGRLPDTVTVKTGGGGQHLYFRLPKKKIKKDSSGKLVGSGVDVLTDGAFVVGVGSRHSSGERYKWENGPSKTEIASLPKAWIRRLRGKRSTSVPSTPINRITEGQRNSALTSFVGKLIHSGMAADDLLNPASTWNERHCFPPLTEEEVARVVASVSRYGTSTQSVSDPAEHVVEALLHQHYAGGKHLALGAGAQFWTYDGKKWAPSAIEVIQGKVLETISALPIKQSMSKNTLMRQTMELLKPKLAHKPVIDLTIPLPSVINCNNGELWISDNGDVELRAHKPESLLRHCLNINYDPKARCPQYEKSLSEIFANAKDSTDLIRHWHELTGYLIQPTRKIPLILILFGAGGNGKTELIKVIAALMGDDLVLWSRIADASSNRFFFGSLSDKLMLVDDDVTIGMKLPDGELKKISEAKKLTAERKYGAEFNFTCLAAPVLLCNSPMSLSDVGAGMQRRLMVLPFERQFTEDEIDRKLFQRITATELPGILNLAIAGYQRVVRRGNHFEKPKAVVKAGKRWLDEANPVATFISEQCERDNKAHVNVSELYRAYTAWAEAAGFTLKQQKTSFVRNVLYILGTGKKKTNAGTSVMGIRLKDSVPF